MTASSSREPTDEDYAHLGRMVYETRQALGLSQREVASLGGPSDTTQSAIEAGEWRMTAKSSGTLNKLDAGLGWGQGIARRVLFERADPFRELQQPPPAPRLNRGRPIPWEELDQMGPRLANIERQIDQLWRRVEALERQRENDAISQRIQAEVRAEVERLWGPEGKAPDADDPVGEARSFQLAARRGQSQGQQARREHDAAGEESQDDGGMDPA